MSSFNGTISYEGQEPTQEQVDQATRHAMDVRLLKSQSGLSRMSRSFDLADGSQVYILDYEFAWKVHIVPPKGYESQTFEPPEPVEELAGKHVSIASFVSGATANTSVVFQPVDWTNPDTNPDAVEGTQATAGIHELMSDTAELFNKTEAEYKLAIAPYIGFYELGDHTPRTQFHHVRPGNYTGAMAPIVQLLLGVGRQLKFDYEDRWLMENDEAPLAIDTPTSSDTSVYYNQPDDDIESYPSAVQIKYDPRWNRTHGIVWGRDKDNRPTPILVEIGSRGVHIMPFPVHEFSKRKYVQDHYEMVYPALKKYTPFKGFKQTLFEAFGGFPTGENIPGDTETLEEYVRAGYVTKSESDASDFYDGTNSIGTYFGWAFHPSSPKAINTGFRFEDNKRIGVCYEVLFDISEKSDAQKVRNARAGQVIAALGLSSKVDKHKALRLSDSQTNQLLSEPDYDLFLEIEVPSDWDVSVNCYSVSQGNIDMPGPQCPGDRAAQFMAPRHGGLVPPMITQTASGECDIIDTPHFKYFEPFIGEVIGFDFQNPAYNALDMPYSGANGPLFATYTSSGPEILYLGIIAGGGSGWRAYSTRNSPCQPTWETGREDVSVTPRGFFYSSSREFRRVIKSEQGFTKRHELHRTGYDDFMSFCAFLATVATLSRRYYGYTTWEGEFWSGQSYHTSAMCASNNRSAFFVCTEHKKTGSHTGRGQTDNVQIGSSGTTLHGHIWHWVWHWTGVCPYPSGAGVEEIGGCRVGSTCRLKICSKYVHSPDNCFGVDEPADPGYSICPSLLGSDEPQVSTFDGETTHGWQAIYSKSYNNNKSTETTMLGGPEGWDEYTQPMREFKWEIWGMGLDLMNGRKIHEGYESMDEREEVPIRASSGHWWRCTIPGKCPTPPFNVSVNYYGKTFLAGQRDIDMSGTVEFGSPLSISFSHSSIPFGVVE